MFAASVIEHLVEEAAKLSVGEREDGEKGDEVAHCGYRGLFFFEEREEKRVRRLVFKIPNY